MVLVIESALNQIHKNLSLEKALLATSKEPLLFLWRNRDCVVIGRNQNPHSECNLPLLKRDGIDLCRRRSGGGCVFQDLDNSVYTFAVPMPRDSAGLKATNNSVLADTLYKLTGKRPEISGRNDLLMDGAKISGAAFKETPDKALHHGCLIRNSILDKIPVYLTPSPLKFVDKAGTDSVRQRVTSLLECSGKRVSHREFSEVLAQCFAERYGPVSRRVSVQREEDVGKTAESELAAAATLKAYEAELAELTDPVWTFGATAPFSVASGVKTEKGLLELRFKVERDTVTDLQIFTDALETGWAENLLQRLRPRVCGLDIKSAQKFVRRPTLFSC
ncbi:lipoate-protein ligase A [Gregarina niphandrodes]|uniref:Lipoate-protein ligase A n=1 Tax=Gregarina niphandrodes TaxID=110365 RepID=A0A023AXS0_GRENI|nr:lipoate-protein ligase A [Gregarina niphandrodes]EZG43452.1 lipoate-protein ligase A [Gregarina niphandrodes]|eukprot:XP_011133303.1 lipoate-protein ligase A [Gregarina niphandrodes]